MYQYVTASNLAYIGFGDIKMIKNFERVLKHLFKNMWINESNYNIHTIKMF